MKKRLGSYPSQGIFLYLGLWMLSSCANQPAAPSKTPLSPTPSITQSVKPEVVLSRDIRPQVIVLFVSDLHGRLRPEANGQGGYARLAQLIKDEKAKAGDQTDVIAVIGGDIAGKSALPCRKTSEKECFALLPEMGFDFAVLGSGELKRSASELNELIEISKLKWFSGNVKSMDRKQLWSPLVEFKGPRSKAEFVFFSWTMPPTPGEVDLKKARLDVTAQISEKEWTLWGQKAKGKSVLLFPHQEYTADLQLLKTACSKPGLVPLALLKSNDHQRREEKSECAQLLEPGAYGENVSRLVFQPDETGRWFLNSHEFVAINEKIPEDAQIKEKIEALYRTHSPTADQVVALVGQDMSERDFAKWAGEAFRRVAPIDIGLVNLGAIKEALKAGPLTEEKLAMIYPYTDELMGVDVGAREFEKTLCLASRRTLDPFEDYGSEIVLVGAELENPGSDQCKLKGPRKASYKLSMVQFLLKRSKRWLGRDYTGMAWKWQVKTDQAFQKLIKASGNKL